MNLNYPLFSLLAVLFLTACENDDSSLSLEQTGPVTTPVEVVLTSSNPSSVLEGTTLDFVVTLSSALSYDLNVELMVTDLDGSQLSDSEYSVTNPIVIPSGELSGTFSVSITDDGESELAENFVFSLANASAVDNNYSSTQYLFESENSYTITVSDAPDALVVTSLGDVAIDFTWVGTSDLDTRILDSDGQTIDTGYSTSPGESIVLEEGEADGNYFVTIRPWNVADAIIDYTFDLTFPDGATESVSGQLVDATGTWTQEDQIIFIQKQTNGEEVTYTINYLN